MKISIRIGSGPESKVDLDLSGDMPNFMYILRSDKWTLFKGMDRNQVLR